MDAELLLRLSGSRLPSYLVTTSNTAHLRFTSDGNGIRTGFQLQWKAAALIEGKPGYI